MSTIIELYFDRGTDPDLERKIKGKGYVIRLMAGIMFSGKNGWIGPYSAIVDTGTHISVIPRRIWSSSDTTVLADHSMSGIVPIDECSIPVLVGEIDAMLIDDKFHTKEIRMISYFALTDEMPLIIGFKTLLEEFEVYFNYKEDTARITFAD